MKILFVCVNYNGANLTDKFLNSIQKLNDDAHELYAESIVVDNASNMTDYSALSTIVQKYENTKLVRSDVNLGYFGGLNLGLHNSNVGNYDYVLVCNNDLEFSEDFYIKLVKKEYPKEVMVVAPNVITSDGYPQNPHVINRVSKTRKFLYDIYFTNFLFAQILTWGSYKIKAMKGGRSNKSSANSQYVHMGIGACYLLTKSFFANFSKLDDSVFLYGEEALLAGQVMSVNGKTFYDSELIVHHAESATLSKLPSKQTYNFAKDSYPHYKKYL